METHQKTSFPIERKEVVFVKPSKPTPLELLSFSTLDNDPNLEIICPSIYVYQPTILTNNNSDEDVSDNIQDHEVPLKFSLKPDPACVIKEAISKLLVHYYPLAGKLKRKEDGNLYVNCNGDGVPFLEATASVQLSSFKYLYGIDVETAREFVFDLPSKTEFGYSPLLFQVTKFSCGGFTIGMGLSHSVCDGFGAAQVFTAMAELASGKNEPTVKPVWERARLVGRSLEEPLKSPINQASFATSPYVPFTDQVSHEIFNVNSKTITGLKMDILKECERDGELMIKESFTTFEVLAAYVWRSRFRAFKLNPCGKTMLNLTIGIRHLLNPPLPTGYYGNAFVPAAVVLTGKDLDEQPLSRVVKLIKESKKLSAKSDHIWTVIDNMKKLQELNFRFNVAGGATTVLTDWRQLGLVDEVDFGWKGSVNMIPVPWSMFDYIGLCIFLPPCKMDTSMKGGVRVLVSLPKAVMPKFKEEMHALLQLGVDDVLN